VLIDAVFDSATSGAAIFHAATGLDATAIATRKPDERNREGLGSHAGPLAARRPGREQLVVVSCFDLNGGYHRFQGPLLARPNGGSGSICDRHRFGLPPGQLRS
jgi:hypothetical protein